MKVGFIGAGQMGEALIRGILRSQLCRPEEVFFVEADADRAELIKSKYAVQQSGDLRHLVEQTDLLVLAVKPQQFSGILEDVASHFTPHKILVSIMAGIRMENIARSFRTQSETPKIVRVMPNAPALVGESMTAIADNGDPASLELVDQVFNGVGDTVIVKEEDLDAITALSGSGPAYFYFFVASLTEGAVRLGLSRDMAYRICLKTMAGAHKVMQTSGENPHILIDRVASPGGTTLAALEVFEKGRLKETVHDALKKAADRSRELSG